MRIESTASVQYPRPLSLLCDVLSKCFRPNPQNTQILKTEVIHSDYCWSVLQYLTHQDAFTLKQVSKGQKEEIDHVLKKGELPNALPEKLDLNGINMLKEAQETSSTERLVKEVNDQLQWDAAFIIHCLEKTKGNKDYAENKRRVLVHAVEVGGIALFQSLKQYELVNTEFLRAWDCIALRWAAACGKVDVLRFLKNECGLTIEDARVKHNEALRWAAHKGQVDVLRFLKNEYGLTTEDARAIGNEALRYAAAFGNVEICKQV